MESAVATRKENPVDRLKMALNSQSVMEQFKNALQDGAQLFTASLIDIYTNDKNLQECTPGSVIMEALKAATLRLPINKNLQFAYIIAYKGKPEFQLGYRGLVQLAIRTGQYKYLNAGIIYEGQSYESDYLTGSVKITGFPTSENPIAYFAHLELLNGFTKTLCWSKEKVDAHAKRYSKSYRLPSSPWQTNFDGMATKTMLRNLLGKYGILSVEMIGAMASDGDELAGDTMAREAIEQNANQGEVIDVVVKDSLTTEQQEPPF